ncbi:CHAT domain-containing protein [Mucilaginibacter terrigena]|uniref:CHAT domain-containing protein n=1 Tax=Mucilaginibacter terrigena TaxID=2492395 RepID=A0A4Q5LMB4_9SPHI|nr:CHAT domain-containing protein [Mucilaginibacter terrigena]RYU90717.1 CHAT domain-containing protein [Mucilaginibacter terrigena]
MPLKYLRFFVLLCLAFCHAAAYAQDATISKNLADLKAKNDLTEWLYQRIDYVNANPQQLPFLLATQKDVWRQPVTLEERIAWLTLLSTQGYDQLQVGDILSSINYYEEAYAYFYKYKVMQFDVVEYVFKPLSNNYTRLGDLERAVFIQQKTVDRLNAFENADDIASTYNNMAIAYYTMGNLDMAANCVARGEKLVKSPAIKFRLQNILAEIFNDQNQLPKARALLQKNISSQKKPDQETAYGKFGAYTTLGDIDLKAGQLNAAENSFKAALSIIDIWFKGYRLREKANLTARLGKIERLRNHPEKALILFDNALRILRINTLQNKTLAQNIYGENKLVEIFHEKALTYRLLKQDGQALENMRYALLANDKIRKEFADNKTKERLQQDGKELAETAIEMAMGLYNTAYDKKYLNLILEIAEQTKARTLADQIQRTKQQLATNIHDTSLRKRLDLERAIAYNERLVMTEKDGAKYQKKVNALKYDLSLLNKKYREQAAGSVLPSAAILAALPEGIHAIEFFFGTRFVYAIDIKNRYVNAVSRIGGTDSLRAQLTLFINTYYRNGPDAMLNSPKEFFLASNQIYTTLFKNTPLQANERLCVIADDVLGYLSFDGLITGNKYEPAMSKWPFLIRKVTTTYAFSLNALIKNKAKDINRDAFSGLFVTHEGSNNTPIIAVKKEATAISKLVKGDYLYDDEVSTKTFFNSFENSGTLHISTHAYLSGINKEPTLDFGKDKLFLFELLARRNKPNLIVLSACRTGDGLLAKGEGIISLSRGFSAIGTPATIAGLWNVNDEAVSQITADMYKFLLRGQSSGAALHQAKLAWLNKAQASDVMYLPYYWDSLILMGADEPVYLQAVSNKVYWYAAMGGALVIIMAFIYLKKQRRNKA